MKAINDSIVIFLNYCQFGEIYRNVPERKMFFELSMFDIQWESKDYSICQIVQNKGVSVS